MICNIFNKKDSFIFLTLFDKFTKLGVEDILFADFLREFKFNLRKTRTNSSGLLFDEIKQNNSTKDKSVIADKLDMLESLMFGVLHIDNINSNLNDEQIKTVSYSSIYFAHDLKEGDVLYFTGSQTGAHAYIERISD